MAEDAERTEEGRRPKMPVNFSWVVEGKLAAMGFPGEDSNIAYLLQNDVTRLITLMENRVPDTENFPDMDILAVKVVDFTPPTLEQIERCMNYIEESIALNKPVGVHCAHGKGRTGTVISCYLVKHYKLGPDEAIEKLRSMRPGSVETSEQEEMVRTFAKTLIREGYIMVASAPIHACLESLTSTMYNFLSKPLAAFPYNHRRNNGQQLERNESCPSDYHQSLERDWPSQGS